MGIRSKLIFASGLALSSAAFIASANAQGLTFATSNQSNNADSPFTYNSSTYQLGILGPVNETYLSYVNDEATPFAPGATSTTIAATLSSFIGQGNGTVSYGTVGTTAIYTENFTTVSGQLLTTNSSGQTNLLHFAFTAGDVNGVNTVLTLTDVGGSLSFSASETLDSGVTGKSVAADYTSDFMKFGNEASTTTSPFVTDEDFTLGLGRNTSAASGTGSSATFNTFSDNGSFTFNSTPLPTGEFPEPSAICLTVMGAGVSFVPMLRRKRSRKA